MKRFLIHSCFHVLGWSMIGFLLLPILGLVLRAPWSRMGELLSQEQSWQALALSLKVSVATAAISFCFGLPLAWLLANKKLPGISLLRSAITFPMVFPPVVGGLALFTAFGKHGLLGALLVKFDIQLSFTTIAAVMSATFVSAPFFILSAETALRQINQKLKDAAATLGASEWKIFRSVTLPALLPSLLAGLTLTWTRALGEFGATITFAGNLQGKTQTLPLAISQIFQNDFEAALLLSILLILLSFIGLFFLHSGSSLYQPKISKS